MPITPTITQQQLTAYQDAKYVVQAASGEFILRVDQTSKALDDYLRRQNAAIAAFITPENPFSQQLSDEQNLQRHHEFLADLKQQGLAYSVGYGVDDAETWPRETSYLILIANQAQGQHLADKYEQNAWLYCCLKQPVRLQFNSNVAVQN